MKANENTVPLIETGAAPRVLVTGAQRLEHTAEGVYTFAFTRELIIDRQRIRRVELYLDCTTGCIGDGLDLIFRQIPQEFSRFFVPQVRLFRGSPRH